MNTSRQKINSKIFQNIVTPMELLQVKFETELEGEKLSENELMLRVVQRERERLEIQQKWLAALAVSVLYEQYAGIRGDAEDE